MPLATLSIDLEAKLAKLQAGMDAATRTVEGSAGKMAAQLDAARSAAQALAGALGVGLSVAFVRQIIDGVDALNDFADAVGTSVENASALEDAARRTGTSLETAEAAALKLNKVLADAKPGSDQAKILESIGLNAQELRRIDPAEALLQVATALSRYENNGNKARIIQELFGKSAKEVAPFLKDLAEQGRLNATVTSEQAAQAERFNKQLAELSKNALDAARNLAGELLPALNRLVAEYRAGIEVFGSAPKALANLALEPTGDAVTRLTELRQQLVDLQAEQRNLMENVGPDQTAGGLAPSLVKQVAEVQKLIKYYETVLRLQGKVVGGRPANEGGGRFLGVSAPELPAPATPGDKAKPFVSNSFDPGVSNALRALEQTDTGKIRELQAQLSALFDLQRETRGDPAVVEAIRRTREEIEKLQNANIGPGILDSAERIKNDFLRSEKAGYEDTDKLLREQQQRVEKSRGLAEDLGATFSSAFEDALISGEKFSDLLKRLEQDILRLVTRKLVTEPLAGGITGFLQGLTGGTGKGDGYDFGKLAGDWIKGLFAGPFADGGFIPPGRWGLVGERGPEPAYGGRTGLTVRPTGSGGMNVYNTFLLPGVIDERTQSQIAATTARAVERASLRNN